MLRAVLRTCRRDAMRARVAIQVEHPNWVYGLTWPDMTTRVVLYYVPSYVDPAAAG